MICMARNKQKIFYSLYEGIEEVYGAYGFTGEYEAKYTEPVEYWANVSEERGEAISNLFGTELDYQKVMVLDIYAPNFDEHTRFWIDHTPDDGTSYDYKVVKIARNLNVTTLALAKVDTYEGKA